MKRSGIHSIAIVLLAAIAVAAPLLPVLGQGLAVTIPLGLDRSMPVPKDNPLTPQKIALGKRLFNDTRLSSDETMACADCHDSQHAFTDQRPASLGVNGRHGMRRVPTLINRGYGSAFFWDGRAATLEDQVLQPIANPNELGMTVQEAIQRVGADPTYRADFKRAFKSAPDAQTMARALASYVRSIVSGNSPYDRFMKGDAAAMTAQQQRGLELFKGKANCVTCHSGPNFTDEQFHNTGVAYRTGALRDEGRYAYTHIASDLGAFKTPTLRDVAESAPYMHDGSISTLKDIVDFYDLNGIANPYLDPKIHPLHLSDQEKTDLIAFLGALSGSAN